MRPQENTALEGIMRMAVMDAQERIVDELKDMATEIGATGVRDWLDEQRAEWDEAAYEEGVRLYWQQHK